MYLLVKREIIKITKEKKKQNSKHKNCKGLCNLEIFLVNCFFSIFFLFLQWGLSFFFLFFFSIYISFFIDIRIVLCYNIENLFTSYKLAYCIIIDIK